MPWFPPPIPPSRLSSCPLVFLGRLLVFPLPQDRPAVDRSKVIAPCFVFHGWRSGPSPGFLLVPALRPSTRVKPLAGGPGASLSHCRALHKNGDPNSGLFSRPRLAVDERAHGLPLGDHQYLASLIFIFVASPGVLAMIHILRPLSRLCRWWTAPWSVSSSSSFYLSSPSST